MKLKDIIKPEPEQWDTVPELNEIPEGMFLVHCDSGYKNCATGVSVIIKTRNKEYTPKKYPCRAKGPVHSELMAVYYGLKEIDKIDADNKKVVVLTDSLYACYFLVGYWIPCKKYIINILEKIKQFEGLFPVSFVKVDGKISKRVDRIAKKVREKAEDEINNNIQQRVMEVEESIRKSKNILIEEINGIFYANSSKNDGKKYFVTLNPPNCECDAWNKKWEQVPEAGRKVRRLPCKHICALASSLGEDVFAIFKKVIERRD